MTRFLGCRGNSLNVVAILGVLMPGIMSVGYNAASLGGVLTFNTFEAQFPDIDVTHSENPSHTSTLQGTVVAVYAIGGFLGTFSCIWLGDILGRRRMIMAASVVQILGATLNATAYSLTQLIVSRVIIGVGTGAILATIPLWQSEISPAHRRGAHVVTKGVFSGIGCALALFLEFGMSFKKGSITWRLPSAFPMFLSFVILGFMFCLPESPRWLLCQNRVLEAREILAALENASADSDVVESRIKEVQVSLDSAGNKTSLGRLYNMGPQRTFHRAILAMGGMIFVQLTGSTVTTFYTTEIFEKDLLLSESTSRLLAGAYQLVGPLGGIVSVLTIEVVGRRKLMMLSAAGNALCLAMVAGLGSHAANITSAHAAIFFIFLFHFSYIIGFGGIPYLYATELAPLHLRTTINSISISMSWAFSILIANVTPIAFNNMGQKYFYIFAAFNASIVPIVYYLFPETSGRELEEIDEIFTNTNSMFDVVKRAKELPKRQPNDVLMEEKLKSGLTVSAVPV
ncbi:hypothetical protein N7481_013094 [Penicillium waksmanii]|uniref:uncharacterized protein n=1 Tax=Penicillium waksmanii TaxID=69791 RepID=UPI0025493AB8|nr:uncharacterized protein N7481_013094 [Penicillium waksmanii]KAJ5966380.1 hypothetical protein N7481_013094 [Penicillium waksmanii]